MQTRSMNAAKRRGVEPRMCRAAGFTLIEAMVLVAFAAIVAAVALPNCRGYVLSGRFVDGANGLAAMRADVEHFHQASADLASGLLPRLPDWREVPAMN
ncbi:MAG TPA: hypothetical protein VF555_07330 [Variovorax sp.]